MLSLAYMTRPGRARPAAAALAVLLGAACAGSTIGSGVGDAMLDSPPYYAGLLNADSSRIGHFAIAYQRGGSQGEIFDPKGGEGTPIARLLAEMNLYFDSLQGSPAIGLVPTNGTPLNVRFSCQTNSVGDCEDPQGRPQMHLAAYRPSSDWITRTVAGADSAGAGRMLIITLETGEYWPRQKGFLGAKEIELGTSHTVDLPRLTSLDDPIQVLQLTGALVGRDGKAIRIGAEGIFARRSSLLESALGAQRLITDEDVEKLRSTHMKGSADLPLVWQVALRNLVRGLTGGAM